MTNDEVFLSYTRRKLEQLCSRIEVCVAKLTPEQVWYRGSDAENAVGNLILHLAGNVRQWVCFGAGGQNDVRQRDAEFAARGDVEAAELISLLKTSLADADRVLAGLTSDDLARVITIQRYEMPVLEALYHVVEHFSQHTGQIILLTKLYTQSDLAFYGHLKAPSHHEQTP